MFLFVVPLMTDGAAIDTKIPAKEVVVTTPAHLNSETPAQIADGVTLTMTDGFTVTMGKAEAEGLDSHEETYEEYLHRNCLEYQAAKPWLGTEC